LETARWSGIETALSNAYARRSGGMQIKVLRGNSYRLFYSWRTVSVRGICCCITTMHARAANVAHVQREFVPRR
jgi:hypothetical protein